LELPNIPVKGDSALICSRADPGAADPVNRPQEKRRILSGDKGSMPSDRCRVRYQTLNPLPPRYLDAFSGIDEAMHLPEVRSTIRNCPNVVVKSIFGLQLGF
jgi:hypothetical protein